MTHSFHRAVLLCFIISVVSCSSELDCFAICGYTKFELQDNSVYGWEGTYCRIGCYDSVMWKCKHVDIDTGRSEVNGGVYIFRTTSLKRKHAGNYTITCPRGSRTISLHVLYPPEKADIYGPYTVEKGSTLNLTCETDSYPPARYWWKYDLSDDSPVIATGATITLRALQNEELFCFAQNTMVPSSGPAITKPPIHTARHIVIKQDPAHIRELPKEFLAYSGFTVSIYCDVGGVPSPVVWWTKHADESFMKSGNRLTADNVQNDFAGVYQCNARNTVRENSSDHTVHVSRDVYVKIIAQPGIHQYWAVLVAVGALVIVLAVTLYYIRKKKILENPRTDNGPSVRLSTIMSSDESVSNQGGHSSNHQPASEETKKKSIDTSDSETQRLYDVL